MRNQTTAANAAQPEPGPDGQSAKWRQACRDSALQSALRKREAGVPSYTVHEAAALLSVSHEYLYRLIRAEAFPAIRMRMGATQGRYVVPANVIETLLKAAEDGGGVAQVAVQATRGVQ